jgi:hypothetical protein
VVLLGMTNYSSTIVSKWTCTAFGTARVVEASIYSDTSTNRRVLLTRRVTSLHRYARVDNVIRTWSRTYK